MINVSPIIVKDLCQAARRRRTFVRRVTWLVVGCMMLFVTQVATLASSGHPDWRTFVEFRHALFARGAWVVAGMLSLLAFIQALGTLTEEWNKRTLAGLRVTLLFPGGVVRGKVGSALALALLDGAALLPVIAIWYFVVRVPVAVGLPLLAVTAGSVVLCASLGILYVAAFRPGIEGIPGLVAVLGPYVGLFLLGTFVRPDDPLLAAAVPFRALSVVVDGRSVGGVSAAWLALLSLALSLAVSAAALAVASPLFVRAVGRHVGAPARGKRRRRRRHFSRRPEMRPNEDPFFWQEKGADARVLRLAVPMVYGVMVVFGVVGGIIERDFRFLRDEWFYTTVVIVGLATLTLTAMTYASDVFSREKVKRTADALILTGCHPRRFYAAKIRAIYWAFRGPFVIVAGVCLVRFTGWGGDWFLVALCAEALVLVPGLVAIFAMVLSATARKAGEAFSAFLIAVLLGGLGVAVILLRGGESGPQPAHLGLAFVLAIVAAVLLVRLVRPLTTNLLMLVLALLLCAGAMALLLVLCVLMPPGQRDFEDIEVAKAVGLVLGTCFSLALAGAWLVLGMRVFDEAMLSEAAQPARAGLKR